MPTARIASKQVSPATSFWLDADHIQTDTANRRWLVRFYLRANNGPGGSASSQYNGAGNQIGYFNGNEFGRHSGNPFLPSGRPDNAQRWNDGPWDVWINSSNGQAWTMPVQMGLFYGNVNGTLAGSIYLPQIGAAPGKPATPVLQQALSTSALFNIFYPADNGGPIQTYNLESARQPQFISGGIQWNSGSGNQVISNLRPDTDYYVRYRAVNAFGTGPFSDPLLIHTLPTDAPGRSVIPSLDGTTATVNMTPPGAMSGVSSYIIERRIGTGAATTIPSPTPSKLVEGLTPGTIYQWRVSAMIDDYQTPWSEWLSVVQPKPNTNPGDYFDGSTPAKADVTYSWLSTVNNSASLTRAPGVLGWKVDASASGGTAVMHRVTGGQSQQFAARVIITGSATSPGVRAGIEPTSALAADVSEGGTYRGRIAVRAPRNQRGVAQISWYTSAMALISHVTITDPVIVGPLAWTLLTGTAVAPVGAASAVVTFVDVAGSGHSLWLSGEYFDVDSAFITLGADLIDYFDGSTQDTPMFAYEWVGAANQSPSLRRTVNQEAPNPLADPDCDPIPGAPQPPVIQNDCIEETGSWRRYWAIIPENEVYDWLTVVPTITVSTAQTPARQVRLRFYENPNSLAPSEADGLPFQSEQIISYMPVNTSVTIDAVSETAWAVVPNYEEELPAEELLYGGDGGPATWPELGCGSSYLISFDVPLDAPINNITIAVALTTRF